MISLNKLAIAVPLLASSIFAAPAPTPLLGASTWEAQLLGLTPGPTPTNVQDAASALNSIYASQPSDSTSTSKLFNIAVALIENGLISGSLTSILGKFLSLTGSNSITNNNPSPTTTIYPKIVESSDPTYDVSESSLRGAIYIPPTFTYGKKPPVILFPGTSSTGYTAYTGNYINLLSNVDYADPVWVNVPHYLLDDAQSNAEYAAYAISYIASITSQNVSVIAWSQGNLDVQWALKYWSSTNSKVSNFIALSPDFHGTVEAYLLCPSGLFSLGCDPAISQQDYSSNFVNTLRANGGDSAYVPTTTVYSGSDEIVEPQSGTGASGYMLDARNVGVSNTQVQLACPGQPAGAIVSHGGMLTNALAFALAVDALTHEGPGDLSRINLAEVCAKNIADGLEVADLLSTTDSSITSLLVTLTYLPKAIAEPSIKAYATY